MRATGKTFRALLNALILFSQCKDVIFISRDERESYEIWKKSSAIMEIFAVDNIEISRFKIRFAGRKNYIEFVGRATYLKRLTDGYYRDIEKLTAIQDYGD